MATILNPFTALGSTLRRRNTLQIVQNQQGAAFTSIADLYTLNEAYYASAAYDIQSGGALKSANGLPRTIRAVLPLIKPAVDYWRGNLYPGVWTSDGRASASGKPNRIPWETDSPDELVAAAQQALTWGNWQSNILLWSFWGALLGDVFAEIEIDYVRRKVYPVLHHPRYVTDLAFNRSGDVIEYRLDIPQYDPVTKRQYRWGKRVTRETVTTYRDGAETGYDDQPATVPNQFRFVPAVWWMFRDMGGSHGAGVIDGLYTLIDELNGIQSTVDDYILKFANQKIIVGSDDPATLYAVLSGTGAYASNTANTKRGATADLAYPAADRENIGVLPAPPGVTAVRMLENMGLADTVPHFDRLMKQVERNLPEVTVEEKLGDLGQLTGPGARAIVAPMQRKLDEAAGGSDANVTKLGQMSVSIMGELVNTLWANDRTDAMDLFRPFRLDSWEKGDLAHLSVAPRVLVQETMGEKALEASQVEKLSSVWAMKHVGLSDGDLYGVDSSGKPNESPPDPGILAEKAEARDREVLAFNAGGGF